MRPVDKRFIGSVKVNTYSHGPPLRNSDVKKLRRAKLLRELKKPTVAAERPKFVKKMAVSRANLVPK